MFKVGKEISSYTSFTKHQIFQNSATHNGPPLRMDSKWNHPIVFSKQVHLLFFNELYQSTSWNQRCLCHHWMDPAPCSPWSPLVTTGQTVLQSHHGLSWRLKTAGGLPVQRNPLGLHLLCPCFPNGHTQVGSMQPLLPGRESECLE